MRDAGLTLQGMFPGLVVFTGPMGYYYLARREASLSGEERPAWRTAMRQAETAGTPLYCAPLPQRGGDKAFLSLARAIRGDSSSVLHESLTA